MGECAASEERGKRSKRRRVSAGRAGEGGRRLKTEVGGLVLCSFPQL